MKLGYVFLYLVAAFLIVAGIMRMLQPYVDLFEAGCLSGAGMLFVIGLTVGLLAKKDRSS